MNIPVWIIYALLCSVCWGTYSIISKIVTSQKYLAIPLTGASLLMLVGIAIVFILFFIFKQSSLSIAFKLISIAMILLLILYALYALYLIKVPITIPVLGYGLLQGIVWAAGMFFVFLAFSVGAPAAKLTPIFNTNTLIAMLLGITLLKEFPNSSQLGTLLVGGLLVVVGGILVSL